MSVSLYGSGNTVIQVVTGTTTTATTTTGTSYVDTALTATITPQSTNSKILVILGATSYIQNSNYNCYAALCLNRNGTIIQEATQMNDCTSGSGNGPANQTGVGLGILDSPATTSALTYKVQVKVESTSYSASITFNRAFNSVTNTSTITLLEISGS